MALKISSLNLYALKNAKAHNTHRFENVHLENPTPVFRRGQQIELDVTFSNRAYSAKMDKIRTIFNYEETEETEKSKMPKGGAWLMDNQDVAEDPRSWSLCMSSYEGKTLRLKMKFPVTCAVGSWKISIITSLRSVITENNTYDHPQSFYVLFNPWHKDDDVYMPDIHLLEEYVMNDVGKVYIGAKGSEVGRSWLFGQFEAHVLPICSELLKAGETYTKKCDPIYVSKMASHVSRVLVGNWSGDYQDGTNPSMWTGSAPILKKYSETKEAVKYGQCWVFASVGCSLSRALGLPARVVTNIVSAMDYDSSLTVDKFYSNNGEFLSHQSESLWNFHAWIDVWMSRPDLPKGFGGWQAIDPTMGTGPSSLEAIKRGEIGFEFDVAEKISEVNSDIVDWKEDSEALLGFKKIKTNSTYVGSQMLTKRPYIFDPVGSRDKDDVMDLYKFPEETKEERMALLRAAMKCSERSSEVYGVQDAKQNEDIKFSLPHIENIFIGKAFNIILEMESTIAEKRKLQIALSLMSLYYNGTTGYVIRKLNQTVEIGPNEKKQHIIVITSDDYLTKLVEFDFIKLYLMATVEETKQSWVAEDDFQIKKPALNIAADGILTVGKSGKILFKFKNPLKRKLTECQLACDCPGTMKYQKVNCRDVLPEENVKIEVAVSPKVQGKFTLVAIFYCKELHELLGSAFIDISP